MQSILNHQIYILWNLAETCLTLSWRRSLSYRNQSIFLLFAKELIPYFIADQTFLEQVKIYVWNVMHFNNKRSTKLMVQTTTSLLKIRLFWFFIIQRHWNSLLPAISNSWSVDYSSDRCAIVKFFLTPSNIYFIASGFVIYQSLRLP